MSEQFSTEAVVIGAGVVGLAVARALAMAGRQVIILEKNAHIGDGDQRPQQRGHPCRDLLFARTRSKLRFAWRGACSFMISAKAMACGHRRMGKLIVATHAGQEEQLAALADHAAANGVHDLKLLGKAEVAALEPELSGTAALLSPSTGIIDSHAYMLALLGDAEAAGASLVRSAAVQAIARDGGRLPAVDRQ